MTENKSIQSDAFIRLLTVMTHRIRRLNTIAFLLTSLFIISCKDLYSQSIQGSTESKFKFYKKHESFNGIVNTKINEVAWKGERIVNQLVIWTSNNSVEELTYQVTPLNGPDDTINAGNINLKFVQYVKGDKESKPCSDYSARDYNVFDELGDILSNTQVTSLAPFDPARIWLSIDIPISIDTGNYYGSVSVKAGGVTALVFDIHLRITDWVIPEKEEWQFHLDLWQYPTQVIDRYNDANPNSRISYWSDQHYEILKRMYTILADKGQKTITAHIKEGALGCSSMIKWKKSVDSSWNYDFSIFDQFVDSLMKWGIGEQINCHSPVGWNSDDIPYWDEILNKEIILNAPIGSLEYNARWNDFLSVFKDHLDSRGWFGKALLYLDEIPENKLNAVINMIKNNNPAWKIGMAGFHQPSQGTIAGVYDLSLMYNVPFGNIDHYKVNTFYFSCNPPFPNNFIASDAKAAGNTFIGWYAQSKNITGFLRWAFDDWIENTPEEMRIGAHTSGDFCLIYRSSNKNDMDILSSIRLELIREGIQDFEKIRLLKEMLSLSSEPDDAYALKLLGQKLDEFKTAIADPENITSLVISGQKLIQDIISGNVSENPATTIYNKHLNRSVTISVYLNSISHILQVESTDNLDIHELRLVDLTGRTVYSKFGINSAECLVDVSSLPDGLYFLRVKGIGKTYAEKVFIR
jgi:hypothetical protein